MNTHLQDVAYGRKKADRVIINGQFVNVHSREIYPGGVAIAGERVAAIGDVTYTIGPDTEVIDAEGHYIVPGFVEGHIHPESSCLSIDRFAEVVASHGTTSVFTDLHEIGVVTGMEGIDAALAEGRETPVKFYFVVPSHVPFSPGLETSGGRFDASIIAPALAREDAVGLSEVVSMHLESGYPDLIASVDAAHRERKTLVGHGPETHGTHWNGYVAAGITNDHEALSAHDVELRLRNGVYAHLRHCLLAPLLPVLITPITEGKMDSRLASLVTDDTSAVVLTNEGHLDYLVRVALSVGVDFITALQMVTINTANSFHYEHEIGSLAPGRFADINLVTGPENFQVLSTFSRGKLVAKGGRLTTPVKPRTHAPVMHHTFHVKAPKIEAKDLVFTAPAGATSADVHIMRTLPWIPLTKGETTTLAVKDGFIQCDTAQDLLHIADIERHHKTGNIGKAFMGGFGLKRGAIASSVGHDNHNIVVMGASPEDMAIAANRVIECEGGIVLVDGGRIVGEIALPLYGLLTDVDAWTLTATRQAMLDKAKEMGCSVPEPFMFLSFVTLAAFPEFAITDKGYIDCIKQEIMDPILKWNS